MNWQLMNNNITKEDRQELINFLEQDNKLTQGEKVLEFEKAWSDWLGVKYSIFVNSGASANLLTMAIIKEIYGVGEVIVPTMTWSSDISSLLHLGFTPVFVDINLNNLAMNTGQILESITDNTKAIFLTHALGFNGLNQQLLDICNVHDIPLIEDCCESHGAKFNDIKIGNFGLMSNFSFYYGHHMTTIEGGMVCTNNEHIYQMLRMMRSHGLLRESNNVKLKEFDYLVDNDINRDFMFIYPGFNFRNTELNAVLGLAQIKRLDNNNAARINNLDIFLSNIDNHKYFTEFLTDGNCSFCLPVILRDKNKDRLNNIINYCNDNHIELRKGLVSGNMLRQPFLQNQRYWYNKHDNADHVNDYALYVGNYPTLDKSYILELCKFLNDA